MSKHVVGHVDEFPPGTQQHVVVKRRGIAIFNVDGELYALRDRCPHQGACLSAGAVRGSLSARGPGEYDYDPSRPVVKCPRHGWEYDLVTGNSSYDPKHSRVRAYEVSVESGPTVAGDEAMPVAGSFQADVVPVSRDGDYVVVEI